MKRIQPVRSYDVDAGYPGDPAATAEPHSTTAAVDSGATRRGFLAALAAGAATLGGALVLADEAHAKPRPALPGQTPAPAPPGPSPTVPAPPPITAPDCGATVTLRPTFRFCGGTTGRVVVETADCRLAATLKQPTEAAPQRRLVQRLLGRQRTCGWLQSPKQVTRMEAALAATLWTHYQQHLRRSLPVLKVQLAIVPPRAPRRPPRLGGVQRRPRLGGVPPLPRKGCASCSAGDSPEGLLLPAGLALLTLYATRRSE